MWALSILRGVCEVSGALHWLLQVMVCVGCAPAAFVVFGGFYHFVSEPSAAAMRAPALTTLLPSVVQRFLSAVGMMDVSKTLLVVFSAAAALDGVLCLASFFFFFCGWWQGQIW